jgi:hypothetical protein
VTRYLFISGDEVTDSSTGEVHDTSMLAQLLVQRPGGIIAGRNLYAILAPVASGLRGDSGWTASISTQNQRGKGGRTLGGAIFFTYLSYRFAKVRTNGVRFRPGSIKWRVLNLELFCETRDIEGAARALVGLAERRGVTPRPTPGGLGGAMLRASPAWEKGRSPAPRFISTIAREMQPGNYYCLRHDYRDTPFAYYLDQRSSHHSIASTVNLPHPTYLRARGRLRAVEVERYPPWISDLAVLSRHVGLLCARIECDTIPSSQLHLYPPWAKQRGERIAWIWTPELRLLDRRIRLRWVSAALTSIRPDPVLREYAEWSIGQLRDHPHPVIKPALLAAYGMLGVRSGEPIEHLTVHGRDKPPRAVVCSLPLIEGVYRSIIESRRTPVLQNVIARGVMEAETRTRSIEFARTLEREGVKVVHIYADGLLAVTDQLPLLPPEWRTIAALTNVVSPNPTSIESDELIRLPGIPNGRRAAHVRPSGVTSPEGKFAIR